MINVDLLVLLLFPPICSTLIKSAGIRLSISSTRGLPNTSSTLAGREAAWKCLALTRNLRFEYIRSLQIINELTLHLFHQKQIVRAFQQGILHEHISYHHCE